jgi:hypothetical protein
VKAESHIFVLFDSRKLGHSAVFNGGILENAEIKMKKRWGHFWMFLQIRQKKLASQ